MKNLALALVAFGGLAANAQELDDIATDRPSFSVAPTTVGTGLWQIESGYLYTKYNGGGNQQTLPNALLRYGWSDDMELQINWTGYSRSSSGGPSGFTDAGVGVKWMLSERRDATQFGFLATLSVPIGESEVSSDSFDPAIGLLWSHSGIADFFGTAKMSASDGDYTFSNGIGIGFAVGDRKSVFVEHQMDIPEHGGTGHQLNSGFSWLRSMDSQIDVHASIGLNDSAADYSIGAGYSIRFR